MVSHIGESVTTVCTPPHTHHKVEISYVTEGVGIFHTELWDKPFEKGDILVIPAYHTHALLSENGHTAISMLTTSELLYFVEKPYALKDNEYREGEQLVRMMCRYDGVEEEFMQKLSQAFMQFIADRIGIKRTAVDVKTAVEKIMDEINRHFSDPEFDVTARLAASGYAENYLRDKFRELTGKTPVRYLNDVRITHARDTIYVYKSDFPISTIALESGFTDLSYFSRCFKKKFGTSPTEFQKQYGRKEGWKQMKEQKKHST